MQGRKVSGAIVILASTVRAFAMLLLLTQAVSNGFNFRVGPLLQNMKPGTLTHTGDMKGLLFRRVRKIAKSDY